MVCSPHLEFAHHRLLLIIKLAMISQLETPFMIEIKEILPMSSQNISWQIELKGA